MQEHGGALQHGTWKTTGRRPTCHRRHVRTSLYLGVSVPDLALPE